ncbi:MAG TPA: cupin domain-containing protein [Solirubrobacteraceae bacterium]|nr:cupin domain-containing protein [Solirubrobacteraceae bacterium]
MSTSLQPNLDAGGVIVPLTGGEPVLRNAQREISILLAREEITITHARYSAGQRVAGPHIHHEHTDAFYVLEGELTFQIGREANTITVRAGGFLAAPPRVAHSFANHSDRPARWLTIHAHDGGFAAFMRGVRDGVKVQWDLAPVPADGGLPASAATVSHDLADNRREAQNQPYRLRCALPDLRIGDWDVRAPHPLDLPPPHQHTQTDTFLILDGAAEATLAGTTQTVGPGTLISVPHAVQHTLHQHGPGPVRILSLHTPNRPRSAGSPSCSSAE